MSRLNSTTAFWSTFLLLFLLYFWDFSLFASAKRLHPMIVGGVHPISDARGYLSTAAIFADTGSLTDWGARRAIFPIFLAGLLILCQHNLYLLHIALAALGAFSTVLVLFTALRITSFAAAVFSMTIIFLFAVVLMQGNLGTESLGLFFGAAALFFLLSSLENQSRKRSICGLFLLSLALAIRPGPLLILPALAIFYSFAINKASRVRKNILINFLVIILPFLFTSYLTRSYSSAPQVPFSNAASVMYGLAKGGVGWEVAYSDHPNAKALPEAEAAEIFLKSSIDMIQESPLSLAKGILNTYLIFLRQGGTFGYLGNIWAARILLVFFLFSTLLPFFKRTDISQKFFSVSCFFTMLSVPISLDGGNRVMAAVMPIVSLALISPFRSSSSVAKKDRHLLFSLGFSCLSVITIFAYSFSHPRKSNSAVATDGTCPSNQQLLYFKTSAGSGVAIDNGYKNTVFGTSLPIEQWQRSILPNSWELKLQDRLKLVQSGKRVITAYDYLSKELLWILSDSRIDSEIGKLNAWCAVCDPKVPDFCELTSKMATAGAN